MAFRAGSSLAWALASAETSAIPTTGSSQATTGCLAQLGLARPRFCPLDLPLRDTIGLLRGVSLVKLPVLQARLQPKPHRARPSAPEGSLESLVRRVFVGIYLFVVVLGLFDGPLARYLYSHRFVDDPVGSRYLRATRIFWTMGLPFAPMFMIVFGYYVWRKVCLIAVFTKLAARIPRAKQRRVPPWFERWGYMVIFTVMYFSLGVRMLATNGSGVFLGVFLMLVLLGAFLTGLIFTGKTWCNFLCPIGLIEKVYLEPSGMGPGAKAQNSQCKKCTACNVATAPTSTSRWATGKKRHPVAAHGDYGWPGLVFAFWAFLGAARTWDYYFSGVWTREPADGRTSLAPAFSSRLWVPKILAVYIALALPTVLSWAVFFTLERTLRRRYGDERGMHYTLSLAAFCRVQYFLSVRGSADLAAGLRGRNPGWAVRHHLPVDHAVGVVLPASHSSSRGRGRARTVRQTLRRALAVEGREAAEDLREAFYVIKRKEQERKSVCASTPTPFAS